jgi:hypothetical protein
MQHGFPRICFVASALAALAAARGVTPDLYRQLQFRYIGPVGNRITAIPSGFSPLSKPEPVSRGRIGRRRAGVSGNRTMAAKTGNR